MTGQILQIKDLTEATPSNLPKNPQNIWFVSLNSVTNKTVKLNLDSLLAYLTGIFTDNNNTIKLTTEKGLNIYKNDPTNPNIDKTRTEYEFNTGILNDIIISANGVYEFANNANKTANTAYSTANGAFKKANNAYDLINTHIQSPYTGDEHHIATESISGFMSSVDKQKLNALVDSGIGVVITTGTGLNGGKTTPDNQFNLSANTASLTQKGIVQLNDTLISSSISEAATANTVKTLFNFISSNLPNMEYFLSTAGVKLGKVGPYNNAQGRLHFPLGTKTLIMVFGIEKIVTFNSNRHSFINVPFYTTLDSSETMEIDALGGVVSVLDRYGYTGEAELENDINSDEQHRFPFVYLDDMMKPMSNIKIGCYNPNPNIGQVRVSYFVVGILDSPIETTPPDDSTSGGSTPPDGSTTGGGSTSTAYSQVYDASGDYTLDLTGASSIQFIIVGAGGGGSSGGGSLTGSGGAGGAIIYGKINPSTVSSITSVQITVGSGGNGGSKLAKDGGKIAGTDGGQSSIAFTGALAFANGGQGGQGGTNINGGFGWNSGVTGLSSIINYSRRHEGLDGQKSNAAGDNRNGGNGSNSILNTLNSLSTEFSLPSFASYTGVSAANGGNDTIAAQNGTRGNGGGGGSDWETNVNGGKGGDGFVWIAWVK